MVGFLYNNLPAGSVYDTLFTIMSFDLVEIQVHDPLREKGVMYVGQYGTSGYATAAKGYIYDFIVKGVPVSWIPLKFDDSVLSDDTPYNILVKTAIDKPLAEVSTIFLHCTADLWPKYKEENKDKFQGRNIIGYTVWETNVLPEKWSDFINQSVNEVWCPSTYNEQVFRESGVTIPLRVVPHRFLRADLPARHNIQMGICGGETLTHNPNVLTFYSISELNERKNVPALIEAYCKAFTQKQDVRLVLKVHYKNYIPENVTYCIGKITQILRQYPDHAPVQLIAKNLSELELLALHSLGDCCVSMTRSEAFGLTLFDAFNYGRKVIAPGYGGHVDYLGKDYAGLVSYTLEDVKNMEGFTHGYYMQGKQQWANPNIDHCVEIMRQVANL